MLSDRFEGGCTVFLQLTPKTCWLKTSQGIIVQKDCERNLISFSSKMAAVKHEVLIEGFLLLCSRPSSILSVIAYLYGRIRQSLQSSPSQYRRPQGFSESLLIPNDVGLCLQRVFRFQPCLELVLAFVERRCRVLKCFKHLMIYFLKDAFYFTVSQYFLFRVS